MTLLCWQQHVIARTWTIINNCNQTVWFGFLGGSPSPAPANNKYKLGPGASNTVNIPNNIWNGVIAGRTNCAGAAGCETGDCGGGEGACTHGFTPPVTQAEFTIQRNTNDSYNINLVNGYNLPISITPTQTATAVNPYFCGSAGAVNPSPGLGSCSWQFAPPIVEYNWVEIGGNACNANSDCTGGKKCGLSFGSSQQNPLQKTCGKPLGYWTANQICSVQRNYGAPFNCGDAVPNQAGITWGSLFACVSPQGCQQPGNAACTCYQPGASVNCCGCVNWNKLGLPVPAITKQCFNSNPNWNNHVQPTLEWLKRGCPTANTYPFDDPSSTFQCGTTGTNTVSYTITFCPSGQVPPPVTTGVINVAASNNSDTVCMNANDTLFLDQSPGGQAFAVSTPGTSVTVDAGSHFFRLASQAGIAAGSGFCSSTVDQNSVTVSPNQTVSVSATYRFKAGTPPADNYSYNLVLAVPYLKVTINDSQPCPTDGNHVCLIANQAVNSTIVIIGQVIRGQGQNSCYLTVQANGSLTRSWNSINCFSNLIPATRTSPGTIYLQSRF